MPSKNDLSKLQNQSETKPILNAKSATKKKVNRIPKGALIEKSRAIKFEALVAQMKYDQDKKNGPELWDEALDLLFEKYDQMIDG